MQVQICVGDVEQLPAGHIFLRRSIDEAAGRQMLQDLESQTLEPPVQNAISNLPCNRKADILVQSAVGLGQRGRCRNPSLHR